MSSYITLNRFATLRTAVVAPPYPLLDAARVKIVLRMTLEPSYIILFPVLDVAYAALLLVVKLNSIEFHSRQILEDLRDSRRLKGWSVLRTYGVYYARKETY